MLTMTTSNERVAGPVSPDGLILGVSATDKIAFYGFTPVVQPSGASQGAATAVTDGSTGTAAATNGIAALTATYNSTLLINAIATLAQGVNAAITLSNRMRVDLVALGLIKGGA